jgi:hypothetical protein
MIVKVITTLVLNSKDRVLRKRFHKREFAQKCFTTVIRAYTPALEMKSFSSSLSLRQIPVCGPAIGSLDLPLVTTISISGRGGGG